MSVAGRLERVGYVLLCLSLAIIFLWFGALKLFDLCPLSGFIGRTMPFLPAKAFLLILACWEIAIGVCLLWRKLRGVGLVLLLLHLPGTVLPLFVLPQECFTSFPFGLSLEGQYIVKNLTLASAALVIAARLARPTRQARPAGRVAKPLRVAERRKGSQRIGGVQQRRPALAPV